MHSTELVFCLPSEGKKKKLPMVISIEALHRQQYGGAQVEAEHLIWAREKPSTSISTTQARSTAWLSQPNRDKALSSPPLSSGKRVKVI